MVRQMKPSNHDNNNNNIPIPVLLTRQDSRDQ